MAEGDFEKIIWLDKNDNPVPKDRATRARIIGEKDGKRYEVYMEKVKEE